MTPDHSLGNGELDELIRRSRQSFIDRNDAGFDFQAGLADVRARARRLPGHVPSGALAAAVADACDRVDEFVALLGRAMLAAELQSLVGGQVQYAAEALLRARDQLLAWSLSGAAAAAAFAAARDALGQADLMARVSTGHSLDAGEDLASLLDQLEHAVISLLPPPGRDGDPGQAQTNRHRRDDPPSGQRRAGGSSP
jgi:hypothetical protein